MDDLRAELITFLAWRFFREPGQAAPHADALIDLLIRLGVLPAQAEVADAIPGAYE